MNDYTADMVPRCFGRYVIDLPADLQPDKMAGATFAIYPYSEFSGALSVMVSPGVRSAFESMVAKRKAELEVMHIDGEPDQAYLDKVIPLPDGGGMIFNRSENGGSRGARTLELHGWKDGYAISMTINANDVDYPEYKDNKQLQEIGSTIKPKLTMLQSLYTRTRGRASDEVPSGSGTCIQNGFVSGPASDNMREDIAVNFVSKTMPDLMLHVATDSGIGADNTLMDRVPDVERAAAASHGRFLKKGDSEAESGLRFQEALLVTPTPDDLPSNLFFKLEANSKQGDTDAPLIDMSLKRVTVKLDPEGNPLNMEETLAKRKPGASALSESESEAMWDAITATLRKRPGAF